MPKDPLNSSNDSSGEAYILSFIVRLWKEELSSQETGTVWRGHVIRVPDGKRNYFKNINELPDLMMAHLKSQP